MEEIKPLEIDEKELLPNDDIFKILKDEIKSKMDDACFQAVADIFNSLYSDQIKIKINGKMLNDIVRKGLMFDDLINYDEFGKYFKLKTVSIDKYNELKEMYDTVKDLLTKSQTENNKLSKENFKLYKELARLQNVPFSSAKGNFLYKYRDEIEKES